MDIARVRPLTAAAAQACCAIAILLVIAAAALAFAPAARAAADPAKVLHVGMPDIESLDPQQYNDAPSFDVLRSIFEGLYEYDYLASPATISPNTATAPPVMSDGGRTWTLRVKPGIYFTADAAFGGKRRELVAADYVYSYKRWLDPNLRRGGDTLATDLIVGARAAVDAARTSGKFDYDAPITGLRAIDRYTLQLQLTDSVFPPIENLLTVGAVPREVVDAAGGDIRTRTVGTGPYLLKEWRRGSRVVLVANPDYRRIAFPRTSNPRHAALARQMEGRAFPRIGVIDIAIIDEDSPRVLEFERGKLDYIRLYSQIATRLLTGDQVRADLAARGIRRATIAEPYSFSFTFNLEDPVSGGMTRERIALRRAIALGIDVTEMIAVVFGGQALPARQLVPPPVVGHDPTLGDRPVYDPAAARALLDRMGYVRRDGDGNRLALDGTPLTLTWSLRSGGPSTEMATLIRKNMTAIGLRADFHVSPFQDMLKELEAGKFAIYYGGYGGIPNGYGKLMQLYSRAPKAQNQSRFARADYDALMETFLHTGDVKAQARAAVGMARIAEAYGPMMPLVYRLENDFMQPWLEGYVPPLFDVYWKYLDIDLARRER